MSGGAGRTDSDAGASKAARAERKADRARREAFFSEAAALTPYLASRSAQGEVFFVRSGDTGVGRRVFVDGWRKDMDVLARAMELLADFGIARPAAPVLLEIGANIGTTTVTALRRHGFASAVALEPSPDNFLLLRLNLVANDVDGRVRAIQAAASDREGELTFDVSHRNSGTHRVPRPGVGPLGDAVISVPAVTVDSLLAEGVVDLDHVGLVWLDAAGHEGHVLSGATTLLEHGVPIVTAIKHGWPETVATVVRHLERHYTDVAELRYLRTRHAVGGLTSVLAPLGRSTDVLAVRRS